MGCLGEYGAYIIDEVLEKDGIQYRFIGSIDRIAVVKQSFAVVADTFTWVRFDGVQIVHVDGAMHFGIESVELVPEGDIHFGWILHTTELFWVVLLMQERRRVTVSFFLCLKDSMASSRLARVGGISVSSFSSPVMISHALIELSMLLTFIFQSM